jgi:hypothetical protein
MFLCVYFSDDNLMKLLILADEYQVGHLKEKCQVYIGEQIRDFSWSFFCYWARCWPTDEHGNYKRKNDYFNLTQAGIFTGQKLKENELVDKMMLYMHACTQFDLEKHKRDVRSLLIIFCENADSACKSRNYPDLPTDTKNEILEALCKKFSKCEI